MSFDYMNMQQAPKFGTYGNINPGYGGNPVVINEQQQKLIEQQRKMQEVIRANETPAISTASSAFSFKTSDNDSSTLSVPVEIGDVEKERKKSVRVRKESGNSNEIIRPEQTTGVVEEMPTAYSYTGTMQILGDTLNMIDQVNSSLLQEFEAVKANRTMKNKYNVLIGLSENVASLISNRISVVKEMNSSIKNSNELDYKKLKDIKQAQGNVSDDKYIADLYKSFITNPQAQTQLQQMPVLDTSTYGSAGIIRANVNNSGNMVGAGADPSYLNYVTNASPEQRLMMYEGNNNVKQCIVYDASTGAKAFQYFDMSNMQPIPNMPVYSDMLLEEFTIDIGNKIARSSTMKEQMPVIIINDNITSQY